MNIRRLAVGEEPPMNLLLLADPSKEKVEEYLQKGSCYVLGEEEVVGVYVLLEISPNTVEIMNVAVSEEMQGKGLGKKLILDAIEKAKVAGYERIVIGTGNSSLNQLALYQKCGFRITAIDRDFFIRNYEEEIYENGIQCVDMIRLSLDLRSNTD